MAEEGGTRGKPQISKAPPGQAEELFKALFNSSPIGIYIVQDGRFELVNPEFQRITGYNHEELLGIEPLTLVLPDDRDSVREKAIRMLKGERLPPYEFQCVSKDRGIRWIMESVISIRYQGKRATLGNFMDITFRKEAEEAIKEMAYLDALTGLRNRRYLLERMDEELARARRYRRPLSVVMADWDNLKRINDRFGHLEGDNVLVRAGAMLRRAVRQSDVVTRYGGDEFVLLLPDTDIAGAVELAERVRRSIEEWNPQIAGETVKTTFSLGVATDTEHRASVDDLLRWADRALYRAKAAGRNRVSLSLEPE